MIMLAPSSVRCTIKSFNQCIVNIYESRHKIIKATSQYVALTVLDLIKPLTPRFTERL